MSISLVKGQKISLTKDNEGLSQIAVGLGWDEYTSKKEKGLKGLFKSMSESASHESIDCDATAFLLRNGKLKSDNRTMDEVSYRQKKSENNCVIHSGDNLTGEGDGDDETIYVDLDKVPQDVDRIVFVVNIYQAFSRRQHFGMIENAFIRVYNRENDEELCRYDLTDDYKGMTALVCGEIYRNGNEWKFNAIGSGTHDGSIDDLRRRYE